MNDTLHDFIAQLERHQAEGRDLGQLLSVDPVRQLALPLNHQTGSQLRAMAQVFQCDEALLASAILGGALRHMQQHLDEDLDALAKLAREALDSPCQAASEAI